MESGMRKARYKVTHTLCSRPDHEAIVCVDVEDREKRECLINVYRAGAAARYVACFDSLRHCGEFRGMFLADGALNAVFALCGGKPIDEVFYRGADIAWQTRLRFAEELFHLGLAISDFPAEIACAAMLSENLRVFPEENRVGVNYVVAPVDWASQREAALLAADQAKKILLRRFSSPKEEIRFLDGLEAGAFQTPVALYAYWQANKSAIWQDYERLYAKPSLGRALYLFFQTIARWFKRKLKARKG